MFTEDNKKVSNSKNKGKPSDRDKQYTLRKL